MLRMSLGSHGKVCKFCHREAKTIFLVDFYQIYLFNIRKNRFYLQILLNQILENVLHGPADPCHLALTFVQTAAALVRHLQSDLNLRRSK